MPRFDDRAREALLEEYVRLRAQNISDAQIARRFGVSQMTILRWKQKYGLAARAGPSDPEAQAAAPAAPREIRAAPGPAYLVTANGEDARQDSSPQSETLRQEVAWLRELAGRLLLENERLRAQLAGRLRLVANRDG